MRKVSDKQQQISRELARIKDTLPKVCKICGGLGFDLAHVLPRSTFPEYVTEPKNLMILCRTCHILYDDGSKDYRSGFSHIVEIVRGYATKEEIFRHFGL